MSEDGKPIDIQYYMPRLQWPASSGLAQCVEHLVTALLNSVKDIAASATQKCSHVVFPRTLCFYMSMEYEAPFPGAYADRPAPEPFPTVRGPFMREDGIEVSVQKPPWGGASITFLHFGPQYSAENVARIGDGDYDAGLDRLADAYLNVPADKVRPGLSRLFQDILEAP
jgi:hypothetical protein